MFFFFQAEDGIRDIGVTGVQTCALPIYQRAPFKLNGHEQPRIGARTTQRRRNRPLRVVRSEERRVGKEGRSRWSPFHEKKMMTYPVTRDLMFKVKLQKL